MKILIINSCGKGKEGSFKGQASLSDLDSIEKRRDYIKKYESKTLPARSLYTGQQAQAVANAVDILRDLGHEVTYKIISAGFGVLDETEEIPPYDVTFSGMRMEEISKLSSKLGINQVIQGLPNGFDMTYLALGKNYLKTFDVGILENKSKLIIHFDRRKKFNNFRGFYQVNENELIGNDENIAEIPSYIGNLVQSKGTIIKNWALYNKIKHIQFPDWWNKVMSKLDNNNRSDSTSISKVGETNIYPSTNTNVIQWNEKENNFLKNTGYDLLMTDDKNLQKKASEIVKKLSDKEIKELYEAHVQLNPRDAKRETRKEWLEKYIEREDEIKKWSEWFNDQIEVVQQSEGSNKTDTRKAFANIIKKRQTDLGYSSYLINPVRLALLDTVVSYIEDPSKLEDSPEYTPRSSQNKEAKLLDSQSFDLQISKTDGTILIGTLINKSNYPMQSLSMKILDNSGEALQILSAQGENFKAVGSEIHISFIKASMSNSSKEVDFKIEINGFYNFDKGYSISITGEDTVAKSEAERTFDMQ